MKNHEWPGHWIDAVLSIFTDRAQEDVADEILCSLQSAGALKEPPKPKVYIMCPKCLVVYPTDNIKEIEKKHRWPNSDKVCENETKFEKVKVLS